MYFDKCECIEDVKGLYYQYAVDYDTGDILGPDARESVDAMRYEYEAAFERLKNVHRNVKGEIYTSKKRTDETASYFSEIIDTVIHFINCDVEVIGSWVWITGKAWVYKEILTELGFKRNSNKNAWAYHPATYRNSKGRNYSMDDLRGKFAAAQ